MDTENERTKIDKKYIYIGVIVIVLITIFLVIFFKNKKYSDFEDLMVLNAKNYVKLYNININEQTYITINEIGIKPISNCSTDSGVNIYRKNNIIIYKPYLMCKSYYSSDVDHEKGSSIELLGANPYVIDSETPYQEPGYNGKGYKVETVSNYKNIPGVYQTTYFVYDGSKRKETVKRTIIVSNVTSSDAPVITLNGEADLTLKVGTSYQEAGYTAIDQKDGNITNKVIVNSNLQINRVGDYTITYMVTNSQGLRSIKKRRISIVNSTLNIISKATLYPEGQTNKNVTIRITNEGDSYAYTILPDGSRTDELAYNYEVTNNQTCIFKIYDKSGNMTEKRVYVENIDRIPPTGTCKATLKGGVVTYVVDAYDDDSWVTSYSYYDGKSYSEFISSNSSKYNFTNINDASVQIRDEAYNTSRISCSTEVLSTISDISIPTSYTMEVGSTYQIPYVLTPTTALASELVFNVVSGSSVSVSTTGVVTALSTGTSVVSVSAPYAKIEKQITITVVNKSSGGSTGGSTGGNGTGSCGKTAQTLTAYYNGTKIARYSKITMHVGETIRLKMYLPTGCGTIKLLTRTTADGQKNWRNYFTGTSEPSVDRNNPSTFLATDHFDWVITADKKTGGQYIQLSQTTFQSTSSFSEIKSFFNINIKVE